MKVRNGERGFTLVESLLALALFALILGSFGALFLRLERTNAVITGLEASENVDLVRRFVKESLEASRAVFEVGSRGARNVKFIGEPGHIVFASVADGDRETGGQYETAIWAEEGRMLLRRQPSGWMGEALSEVLLTNVESVSFAYFPCPAQDAPRDAHHWQPADRLPYRIDVSVAFRPGDHRAWRDLSVFPAASACPAGG